MIYDKLKSISGQQPPVTAGRSQNWQSVIWREWRNSDGKEYAGRLFELVADEPIEQQGKTLIVTLVALCGTAAGILLGLAETINHIEKSKGIGLTQLAGYVKLGQS